MNTATITYEGNLRTTCTHLQSGTAIITDAPTDNCGNGEAFSPTDLLATSLVSCMITTMGIRAQKEGIPFKIARAEMKKIMAANPRRVAEIVVELHLSSIGLAEGQHNILEDAALNCPVAMSLGAEVIQSISFHYDA